MDNMKRFRASSGEGGPAVRRALPAMVAVALVAGCATQQLDAQWSNPDKTASSLRGEKVLVVCQANEPVVRQICQDKLASELAALGALVVRADPSLAAGGNEAGPRLSAARSAGARAVFNVAISPDVSQATNSGMSVGFGLGGFGFGHGGFGGVGVSAPIGGDIRVQTGYAGNASLLDSGSGTLLWTAKTRSNPNNDTDAQLAYIARALAEGARKAGRL